MSENNMFTIMRADKLNFDARLQISEIFADGFTQWLVFFPKDKSTIARAFAHMFILDQFYVAVSNNKIAGMVSCSASNTLSVKLNKIELRRHLGFFKGSIAAIALKKEFESSLDNSSPEACSIGFVGTASEFRGKGTASQIIRYIIENTTYREYIIDEVADTNTPAMNLYKKLGFKEYKSIPVPQIRAKKIGINNFVALKYIKN